MNKSESKIQQEIVVWINNTFCLKHHDPRGVLFHVPNENQHHLIGVGLLSGVSDLIFISRGKVLFLEVKTPTGKQSPKQKDFESRVTALGFEYHLVRSLEEVKQIMNQ